MRVSLIKDGLVENVIEADSVERAALVFPGHVCVGVDDGQGIGWEYDGQALSPPPDAGAAVRTWESGWYFAREFSVQEESTIRAAARTDPVVETFVARAYSAPAVRGDDPDVVAGLDYLVSQALLAVERKAQILGGE